MKFFVADDLFVRKVGGTYYVLVNETKLSTSAILSTRQSEFLQALQSGKKVFTTRSRIKEISDTIPQGSPINVEGYVKITSDSTINGIISVSKLY